MTELLATFLAGLALFFHGVSGIRENLQGLTSRRLRRQLARWAKHPVLAGLWGFGFGAITQSSTAVAFILTGLVEGGLMAVTRALPIVAWANLGTVLLVFFASFNLHLAFLYLLGTAGLALAFNIGGPRLRPTIATLFCVGVLFLGLHLMKTAFAPLAGFEWFNDFAAFIQHSTLAVFVAGALLRVLVQSSSGIAVIAITLAHGGLLTVEQAIMMVYGTAIGVGLSVALLSSNLRGIPRRLALYQALINSCSGLTLAGLFYLESLSGLSLLVALAERFTSDDSLRLAFAFLFLQSIAVGIALTFASPAAKWLERLAPATDEQDLSQPRFLTDQAFEDPESALELVEQEQLRLLQFLPQQLDTVRAETAAHVSLQAQTLHRAGNSVGAEIDAFLRELVERPADHATSGRLFATERRQSVIASLQESLDQFVTTFSVLHPAPEADIDPVLHSLCESLNTILLTAIDAYQSGDQFDQDFLNAMTADRSEMMAQLRTRLLTSAQPLDQQQKSHLSALTTIFERMVWLLRKLGQSQQTSPSA